MGVTNEVASFYLVDDQAKPCTPFVLRSDRLRKLGGESRQIGSFVKKSQGQVEHDANKCRNCAPLASAHSQPADFPPFIG